jgi:hypothetical protein
MKLFILRGLYLVIRVAIQDSLDEFIPDQLHFSPLNPMKKYRFST